jgi:hypothetical protein
MDENQAPQQEQVPLRQDTSYKPVRVSFTSLAGGLMYGLLAFIGFIGLAFTRYHWQGALCLIVFGFFCWRHLQHVLYVKEDQPKKKE